MRRFVITAASILALASTSSAATDLDAHANRLRRHTGPEGTFAQKTLCVCQVDGALSAAGGYLVTTRQDLSGATQLQVQCAIPRYSPAGDRTVINLCPRFVTIGR